MQMNMSHNIHHDIDRALKWYFTESTIGCANKCAAYETCWLAPGVTG